MANIYFTDELDQLWNACEALEASHFAMRLVLAHLKDRKRSEEGPEARVARLEMQLNSLRVLVESLDTPLETINHRLDDLVCDLCPHVGVQGGAA